MLCDLQFLEKIGPKMDSIPVKIQNEDTGILPSVMLLKGIVLIKVISTDIKKHTRKFINPCPLLNTILCKKLELFLCFLYHLLLFALKNILSDLKVFSEGMFASFPIKCFPPAVYSKLS